MNGQEWSELNPEVQDMWNQNAGFWDDYMGEAGNDHHKLLIRPAVEELLDVQPDELVLDIACGNGNFSRHMARLGAQVVATDISQTMIERAQQYQKQAGRITYQVVDAANSEQLLALGTGCFDAAVSNMALMDMSTIEPLLESLAQLLKPGGRFVFSTQHPSFLPHGSKIVEQSDREGKIITQYGLKITTYITPTVSTGLAIRGQPVPHYYFHRPLSLLLDYCFKAGFVLDGLKEPVFDSSLANNRDLSWDNFNEIPLVLVARLRLPQS